MPQHVVLSNGAKLDIPDGTPPEEVKARAAHMESLINPQWKGFGSISDAAESTRNLMSYVTNPAERVATAALNFNPYVGGYDLAAGGVNAAKSIASKYYEPLRNIPDLPSITDTVGNVVGTPAMPQDAPAAQRYAEAAATAVLNPKQTMMTALRMVGATGGGDIGSNVGQYFGGPEYEKFGRWLGSIAGGTPEVATKPVGTAIAATAAAKDAPATAQAAENLGVQPSFGSLANTPWRLIEKALGSIPIVNWPIISAQNRVEEGVQKGRNTVAEQVNQGPLPTDIDPASIGGNLITLARNKVAEIKQGFNDRYNALDAKVGPQTLVDAQPTIDAIIQQSKDPTLDAQQKQDLIDRANYLKSMTAGNPGYNGPQYTGNLPTTPTMAAPIPLGQLTTFRTRLGDEIGNLNGIDQRAQGPVRDAITATMQQLHDSQGTGQEFRNINESYARNFGPGTTTEALEAVGGKAVPGKPGVYTGGMNEKQASDWLTRSGQSPSELEPFVDPNNPYWRAAASQLIARLGDVNQGGFRADTFSTQAGKISSEVVPQLLQDPNGGPLQPATNLFDSAQQLGQNASVAASRHGLTQSIGSLAAVELVANHFRDALSAAGLPAELIVPAAMMMANRALESKTMTDTMSGRSSSTPIVDSLYTSYPYAATSLALNNPDNPYNQQPQGPRPPSPLDQVNNPPQPQPQPQPPQTPPNMNPPPAYNF